MDERLGIDHQRLQKFMTSSTWRVEDVRARLAWHAVAAVRPEVRVVDDTGFPPHWSRAPATAWTTRGPLLHQPTPARHPRHRSPPPPHRQRRTPKAPQPGPAPGPRTDFRMTTASSAEHSASSSSPPAHPEPALVLPSPPSTTGCGVGIQERPEAPTVSSGVGRHS
ncbi:transposase [Streptomyces sp. NPDC087297]|uniref:transposase n=1 Tax=Streptomyces sp. NPDC087297 TaxID=3365778 RepID=UPI0037F5BA13